MTITIELNDGTKVTVNSLGEAWKIINTISPHKIPKYEEFIKKWTENQPLKKD